MTQSTLRVRAIALLAAPLLLVPAIAAAGRPGGQAICHIPPGSAESAHTIVVSEAALPAHLGHGDVPGPCPAACSPNGDACGADGECCSASCAGGTCATPCAPNGDACGSGAECCSGSCDAGTCATPCAANGSACSDGGDCCTGLCNSGVCVAPCTTNGNACGSGADCCSGLCDGGVCQAPCADDGGACETGADCCSGICTDTTKTCASACTLSAEWGDAECSPGLDCCEGYGLCLNGACYPEDGQFTCVMEGEPCDEFTGTWCCFSLSCACADAECTVKTCVEP
jgi:hypothetical protein